jgi:hypothetical protein
VLAEHSRRPGMGQYRMGLTLRYRPSLMACTGELPRLPGACQRGVPPVVRPSVRPERAAGSPSERLVGKLGLAVQPAHPSKPDARRGMVTGGGRTECYAQANRPLDPGVATQRCWAHLPDVSVCLNPEKWPRGPGGGGLQEVEHGNRHKSSLLRRNGAGARRGGPPGAPEQAVGTNTGGTGSGPPCCSRPSQASRRGPCCSWPPTSTCSWA